MNRIYRVYKHEFVPGKPTTYRIVYLSGRQVYEVERLLPKTVQQFIIEKIINGNVATVYNPVYECIETVYG